MTPLRSLEEHNNLASKPQKTGPHPNGIACPECGAELLDSEPGFQLASNPPQYRIHCGGCGYRGTRN